MFFGEGKVFPELNEAPRHEDAWGSEGISVSNLNLGARLR